MENTFVIGKGVHLFLGFNSLLARINTSLIDEFYLFFTKELL